MVRFSEMALAGHPDKLCDQIADRILAEAYAVDPEAYGQIEVGCWRSEFYLTGSIATRTPLRAPLERIVCEVGIQVGFKPGNHADASNWRVHDAVWQVIEDPRTWTERTNDQCVVVGYAGYDRRCGYLPPEHYLAHRFREALTRSCRNGRLRGHGPDGKLLVRIKEERDQWELEHILVSLQQRPGAAFPAFVSLIEAELSSAYDQLRADDTRWVAQWPDVEKLINPNGPWENGGPDGDNGQTGRKLVMDYYGPRVPIGGGALSGKNFSNVDRAGAYTARRLAIEAVEGGARECLLTASYSPNIDRPIDIVVQQIGGRPVDRHELNHDRMRANSSTWRISGDLGAGTHFYGDHGWNRVQKECFGNGG